MLRKRFARNRPFGLIAAHAFGQNPEVGPSLSSPAPYRLGVKIDGHLGSVEFNGGSVVVRKTARGEIRVPLAGIQSVSIIPAGFGMSAIRFAVAGGSAPAGQANILVGHADVAQDPYAVTFRNGKKDRFRELVGAVEAARFVPAASAPAPPQQDFPAGWYPEGTRRRYWDGRAWTDYYA